MSEIDLTKPLQWSPDGKTWLDVTCSPKLHDGTVYLQVGTGTTLWVTNPETSDSLRNKPEPAPPKVRPYTFEEAVYFVGKAVRGTTGVFAVTSAYLDGTLYITGVGHISLKDALRRVTHPDGTIFGVIEYE